MIASWKEFKFQIRAYFERKESYSTVLARISARTWKSHTEKFVEYAEEKLNLMQFFKLSEKEKIELLTNGVKNYTLSKTVLNTIPEFIEHVRRITEDSVISKKGEQFPKSLDKKPNNGKINSSEEKTCFICKKTGHLVADCKVAKVTCFKCGQTGHFNTICSKREAHGVAVNNVEQQEMPPSDVPSLQLRVTYYKLIRYALIMGRSRV